jgi:hypothetical protein
MFVYQGVDIPADTNGLLYWLGTHRGADPVWRNPMELGQVQVYMSSTQVFYFIPSAQLSVNHVSFAYLSEACMYCIVFRVTPSLLCVWSVATRSAA